MIRNNNNILRFECSDCVRFIRAHIDDDTVDLVLADPPYGIDVAEWDSEASATSTDWLCEVKRVLKPGGSLVFFGSPCSITVSRLNVFLNDALGMQHVQSLAWVYTQGAGSRTSSMRRYGVQHEHIEWWAKPGAKPPCFNPQTIPYSESERRVALAKAPGRITTASLDRGRPPRSYISVPRVNSRSRERRWGSHPCMKPVELCRLLIRTHCNPGDVVLVPFAGSGSEVVATLMEGRRVYACEMNEIYMDVARRRIDEMFS